MKIAASCEAAECINPDGPKVVSTAQPARIGPPIAPPLVAALPLLLLVLGGLACSAALIRYKPYLRGSGAANRASSSSSNSKIDSKDVGGAAAVGAAAAAAAASKLSSSGGSDAAAGVAAVPVLTRTGPGTGRIAMLAFADITADVQVPRTWKDITCVKALRNWRHQGSAPAEPAGGSKGEGFGSASYDLERGSNGSSKGDEDSPTPASGSSSSGRNSTLIVPNGAPVPAAAAAGAAAAGSSSRWRPVLRGVSGSVASGQVLGVMGPSGGGKSTLLLKLCGSLGAGGRSSRWRSSGLVTLDGVVAPASLLSALTAFVPQDDSLMRSLTVEECIRCVLYGPFFLDALVWIHLLHACKQCCSRFAADLSLAGLLPNFAPSCLLVHALLHGT
jgi:ABC-type multidrug transport system fused ATPase/permease subunit